MSIPRRIKSRRSLNMEYLERWSGAGTGKLADRFDVAD
jgi:hypothetical protein